VKFLRVFPDKAAEKKGGKKEKPIVVLTLLLFWKQAL
jgi:hypothetical protein